MSVVQKIDEASVKQWSYSYTASGGFATEENVLKINIEIDDYIKDRLSTRIEGDCITFTFSRELTLDDNAQMAKIFQILVDTSKPKVKYFTAYPKVDNTDSTTFVLMGRISYRKLTTNQTLDYIDVMVKLETGSSYSIKIVCDKLTIVEFSGNNNEFETFDMGKLENTPSNNSTLEIYAQTDGIVYVDQLQLYYNP